ncbi:MAG: glycoside hydrolase family 15 protein, partial [Actinobacteria bacterium]|nr:glycoside hydrolase family 15 protein [Actinomycetota bacterium]
MGQSPFPPIASYGFLSDCEVTALVAPSGNVEWLCLPRMDSPSVFGAILDRGAGGFRLGPADAAVPAARRYLPGTMVLETSWGTTTGWIIVRDVLLIGPWHHQDDRSHTHRRAPTDYDADHVLLRIVRCVNGEVQVTLDCEPIFDYGRSPARWSYTDRGYYQGLAQADGVDIQLRLTSDMRVGFEGTRAVGRTLLKDGDTRFCALSWSEHQPPTTSEEAHRRMIWTAHHWQHWLARGQFPDHPWRSTLQRSALTLKGLTFAPTGALVAASTTSLPETPGGERNWDYRYSWIRDSTFALWALYALGFDWEANDFFWFIADVAERDEELQVMYGVGGERDLDERVLEHLHGYEGARPVRVGNGAHRQRQHDLWGAVLDSVYIHTTSRDRLDERIWPILRRQVESAMEHWREPDRGMWEVRGSPKHFTSSKIMCWVAADRGARLARIRDEPDLVERWQAAADEIHADVCANGVDERGVFTQHYDTDALDASLLLMPLVRFLPPQDPRVRATVLAVADELTVDGLVLRYRVKETDDGLSGEEGSFAICSFWLVSALTEIGEHLRARQLCEKLLS